MSKQITLFFCLLPLWCIAQSFHTEQYGLEEGLSKQSVNCLLQDSRGFIWIGTGNGLNRFDGQEFIHFTHQQNEPNSLSNDRVNVLMEDQNGKIWIGTSFGLNCFDPKTETFTTFFHDPNNPNSLAYNNIHVLFEDQNGEIWIAASLFLDRYNPRTGQFTHYQWPSQMGMKPGHQLFRDIIEHKGALYAATWGEGVLRLNRKTGEFHMVASSFKPIESLPGISGWIEFLEVNQNGELLAGLDAGVGRYIPEKDSFQLEFVNPSPGYLECNTRLTQAPDGTYWVGTTGIGFQRLNQDFELLDQHLLSKNTNVQHHNYVSATLLDKSGAIWMGTVTNGLFKINTQANPFEAISRSSEGVAEDFSRVKAVLKTSSGEIWAGTRENGISVYDEEKNIFRPIKEWKSYPEGLPDKVVITLNEDSNGQIWIGTWSYGTLVYQPATNSLIRLIDYYQDSGGEYVSCVLETKSGVVWQGTPSGLIGIDKDRLEKGPIYFFRQGEANGLSGSYVTALAESQSNSLWVGTANGLNWVDPQNNICKQYPYDPEKGFIIPNSRINALFEDHNQILWVGTSSGLYRFDYQKGDVLHLNPKDGLSHSEVLALVPDHKEEHFWLTTSKGLSRLNLKDLTFTNYFESDGLPDHLFVGSCLYVEPSNGKIWAASEEQLVRFHPDRIQSTSFPSNLAISRLVKHVSDEKGFRQVVIPGISRKDAIELKHFENTLTFSFANLNFLQSANSSFSYRLDGVSKDWIDLGSDNQITLSQLPTGSYQLHYRAFVDGTLVEGDQSLRIIIHPPWYNSSLAWIAYLVLLLGVIWFWRKRELKSQSLKYQLEFEQVEAEKLKELDQMKSKLYSNLTHEFRTPLTVISGLAENISSQNLRDTILRNTDRLLRLINQFLDLAKLEAGSVRVYWKQGDIVAYAKYILESFASYAKQRQVTLSFQSSVPQLILDFDEQKFQTILSNLLSNAIKFSPSGGRIEVILYPTSGHLEIQVKDQGKGIAEDQLPFIFQRFYQADESADIGIGTGIGLALTKELVELMGGSIQVESEFGKGSVFLLRLPIRQDATDPFQVPLSVPISEVPSKEPFRQVKHVLDADAPNLLIVEDNVDVAHYMCSLLEGYYHLTVAENGRLGLEKAISQIPDLIISDVMMPEMNGYELTRSLKKDERTSHIPIILLTAKADLPARLEGIEEGADVYLTKPFHKEELLIRIRKLLELRTLLQQQFSENLNGQSVPSKQKPDSSSSTVKEDAFLKKVISIILAHLDESDFGVAPLCQELGMSQSQLYRKIKALTGYSTVAFIRKCRLQEAKKMLDEFDLNISEVAYKSGFSDPAYFSRLFSEEFGVSPSKYRK